MKKYIIGLGTLLLCMMSQVAISATSDYQPLEPGTVWKYITSGGETIERKVLAKKVNVNGADTSVLKFVQENLKEYYTSDSNGIQLHRQFQPRVYVSGRWVNVDATFSPPIIFVRDTMVIGETVNSVGSVTIRAAGRTIGASYVADTIVVSTENITVPAGNFDTVRVDTSLTLNSSFGSFVISSIRNVAEGIGVVKDVSTDTEGVITSAELVYTNAGIYDLAITNVIPPKSVTLSPSVPSKTSPVKVKIQNRGPYPATIEDATMLTNLITLTVESLGSCPAPTPSLHTGKPQKSLPITLKPHKSLTVYYDVPFGCANNPDKGTPDYRFSAVVNRSVLDGKEDTNPSDDVCPRNGTLPTDKGCGAKNQDGSLGGDILTDVVVKQ